MHMWNEMRISVKRVNQYILLILTKITNKQLQTVTRAERRAAARAKKEMMLTGQVGPEAEFLAAQEKLRDDDATINDDDDDANMSEDDENDKL